MAGISFELFGDASGLLSALGKSEKAFTDLNKTAEQSGQGIDKVMEKLNGLASIAGVSFGAAGMAAFAKKIYEARSAMQDLESTMKVFLGSGEKAAKFTQELQNYAYWNMFEFTDLTEASTQLMAYGTATEDLIPIIDKLSNVATGTKKPLQDYIELFNKAKATGKVDANGLERWAAAGIVLKDELKKMNVEVSGSTVTFKQLEQVLDKVTSDGERFGGLMMSQMDNLSASWGQLEDNFANMLNELGTDLQDVFKGGIDFASTLIDNYDKIGKALATLILMYGEYKAVLIATRAIQSASVLLDNIRLIGMFRKELGLLKAAQQAFNITAMQNPYILLASVLIMTVTAIVGLTKAFSDDRTEMEKLNDAYDERNRSIQDDMRLAGEHIRTLKDETATTEALTYARKELAKNPLLKGKDIRGKSVDYIIKELEKSQKEAEQKAKEELQNGRDTQRQNAIDNMLEQSDKYNQYKQGFGGIEKQMAGNAKKKMLGYADEVVKVDEEEIKEFTEALKTSKKPLSEQKTILEGYIQDQEALQQTYKQTIADLSRKNVLTKEEQHLYAMSQLNALRATKAIEWYGDALREVNHDISEENKKKETGYNFAQLVKAIKDKEEEVYAAREAYKALTSDKNKETLENEEKELKGLTDKYKLATGQTWQDTKKLTEEETKLLNKAIAERLKAESHFLSDRYKRELQYHEDLRKLDEEEAEYNKKNNGGTDESKKIFAERRQTIELEYKNDKEAFMREFNEMIRTVEQEVIDIRTNIDTSNLERAVGYATTYTDKLILQNALLEQQVSTQEKKLDEKIATEAEKKYGKETIDAYKQYKAGELEPASDAQKATYEEMDRFFAAYESRRKAMLDQIKSQNAAELLDMEMQNFEEYADGMIQAEQDYQEELKSIREKYGLNADADVEKSKDANIKAEVDAAKAQRDRAKKSVEDKTGIVDNELVERLNGLGETIAGKTKQEIQVIYNQFIDEIDRQIEELKSKEMSIITTEQANIDTEQTRMEEIDTELQGEGLSEEDKTALLQERATLEEQIATSMQLQAEATERLNGVQGQIAQLTTVKANAEKISANATSKALTAEEKQQKKVNRQKEVSIQGLETVRDTANAVANTFGGALSSKAKKALTTIAEVADFGISAVKGVESIVNGVSKGMEATSTAAAQSMSTVEKASVILTVISIAVQLIMKIVEIASQFTKSAQLQESIDKHLEKVEDLKHKNEQLQRAYKSKTGIDYYKGMTAAAKDLSKVMREQEAALKEAQALYELQASKYGEDSDKAKDAKEQMNDIQDQYNETADQQAEQFAEVANELGTTDLSSFSQSLAESIVEGFANGMEGIDDVFENSMQDLYRSMMTKQLALALEKQFEGVFTELNKRANDGDSLTRSDIDVLMDMMDQAEEGAQSIAQAYYDLFSERGLLEDADAEGSQGFGQMTQDQADTLTARFTALQIEGANMSAAIQQMAVIASEAATDLKLAATNTQALLYNSNISVQIAQEQLEQLEAIAGNTAMLAETNNRLKSIEQHTSKL